MQPRNDSIVTAQFQFLLVRVTDRLYFVVLKIKRLVTYPADGYHVSGIGQLTAGLYHCTVSRRRRRIGYDPVSLLAADLGVDFRNLHDYYVLSQTRT